MQANTGVTERDESSAAGPYRQHLAAVVRLVGVLAVVALLAAACAPSGTPASSDDSDAPAATAASGVPPSTTDAETAASGTETVGCAPGDTLDFAFYTGFAPISYSDNDDSPGGESEVHAGYSADLLTALEAMDGAGLRFERIPVSEWSDIWLLPASGAADIAGGGMSILESRTRNEAGDEVVAFTNGHISYRQSLLVRAGETEQFADFSGLNGGTRVGSFRDTTNEQRLLELTQITDASGILAAGTRIHTPDGVVTADGTDAYRITAAGDSEAVEHRTRLEPPSSDQPAVHYDFGGVSAPDALASRDIDAVMHDMISNTQTADSYGGGGVLAVAALDDLVEWGGWTLRAGDTDLLDCLNAKIDYLTDGRRIGYSQWRQDPDIFVERALQWTPATPTPTIADDSSD
ncbi:MAG: transporter substrate-binding domain-containing protein [Acidimicrobiaceae bacterium]|nr:transporter substrate-binding domain-containing protein [Acidimicrobiaceae bacterium]